MHDVPTLQDALEHEQKILVTQLTTLGVQDPSNPADWITAQTGPAEADENVVADRTEAFNETRATLATLETRYNNIVRALRKISAGTYGVCEIGGGMIDSERLVANPAARSCKAHMDAETNLLS